MQLHWAEGIVRTSVVRAETYMSRESKTALVVSSSLVGVVTTGVGVVQDWSERARIPHPTVRVLSSPVLPSLYMTACARAPAREAGQTR